MPITSVFLRKRQRERVIEEEVVSRQSRETGPPPRVANSYQKLE